MAQPISGVKGGGWAIDGQEVWLTSWSTANLMAVLVWTEDQPDSPHWSMSTFLVEKDVGIGETAPGLTIPGKIGKIGYKGDLQRERRVVAVSATEVVPSAPPRSGPVVAKPAIRRGSGPGESHGARPPVLVRRVMTEVVTLGAHGL